MGGTSAGGGGAPGLSAEFERLVAALRALLSGHWALLRAERGAIARDALLTLVGAIAVVALLVMALLGLLVALFLVAGEQLFGSMLWGAAHMTLLLLSLAAAIASGIARIGRGRRIRSLVLALVGGAGGALLALYPLGAGVPFAAGLSVACALALLLLDLLAGFASFDAQRFTDRFLPLASEAELRATVDALDDLRGEALAGVAAEVGAAAANAEGTLGALRSGITRLADAVRDVADRLRPEREPGGGER